MADFQQWRRMMQPSRARTPAVEVEETETAGSPTPARRPLRSKPSTNLLVPGSPSSAARPGTPPIDDDDGWLQRFPSWAKEMPFPKPEPVRMMDGLISRLLVHPYTALDPAHNGTLLQIFEALRSAEDDKAHLQAQLEEQTSKNKAIVRTLRQAQEQWAEERQDYKDEITLARQHSQLRQKQSINCGVKVDDGLEAILQAVENSWRHEDKALMSQRASKRHVSLSVHHSPTTPTASSRMQRQGADLAAARTSPDHKDALAHITDDVFSSFSSLGDFLPDEDIIIRPDSTSAAPDADLSAILGIAESLARRRNLKSSDVLPKLLRIFDIRTAGYTITHGGRVTVTAAPATPISVSKTRRAPSNSKPLQKQPSLMAKASGFFQRLRLAPYGDANTTSERRFSFERGDDLTTHTPRTLQVPQTVSPRALRKSVSLSFLSQSKMSGGCTTRPFTETVDETAPISQFTGTSEKRDMLPMSALASRIPTPVYNSHSTARPRREREDSHSSLLTAIRYCEDTPRPSSFDKSPKEHSVHISEPVAPESAWSSSYRSSPTIVATERGRFALANLTPLDASDPYDSWHSSMRKIRVATTSAFVCDESKENAPPTSPSGDAVRL